MNYGYKKVNNKNRRGKSALGMRLECPREKIVVMIGRKYRRQKKPKRVHNEVEIYVALTVMRLVL